MSQYNFDYDTYYSDHYAGLLEELNVVRNINGGTVFKIDYEGIWNNQMKGAFEYACKIWEEQLPQSMPIKLRQKLGFYRSLKP